MPPYTEQWICNGAVVDTFRADTYNRTDVKKWRSRCWEKYFLRNNLPPPPPPPEKKKETNTFEPIWKAAELVTVGAGAHAERELRRLCSEAHIQGNATTVLKTFSLRGTVDTKNARVWLTIDQTFNSIERVAQCNAASSQAGAMPRFWEVLLQDEPGSHSQPYAFLLERAGSETPEEID